MNKHTRWLGLSLKNWMSSGSKSRKPKRSPRSRLELEALENRTLLSATATLTGTVFVDQNTNGVNDAGEARLPGIDVHLTGTTNAGAGVDVHVTTNLSGLYRLDNLEPGTYQLTSLAKGFLGFDSNIQSASGLLGQESVSGITVADGQSANVDLGFRGLAPSFISLRQFLSSTQETSDFFPFGAAGTGQNNVNPPPTPPTPTPPTNDAPVVQTALPDVAVPVSSPDKTIDLAGFFTDPNITDSQVHFDISSGGTNSSVNVELFDKAAPRTVANFLNYVKSNAYDSSFFHRLASGFVLQGGGFTFNDSTKTIGTIPTDPAVQNEPGASNTIGTIAMAKLGTDPNSATDQFFFNLGDNSANLDNQNGGFTVFGKVVSPADQSVISTLATTPVRSQTTANSAFDTIPLNNYPGPNNSATFPADSTKDNYVLVNDIAIVRQTEALTYTASSSNPGLVTTAIKDNRLTLHYIAGQTGTATISVTATDKAGANVTATFNITVS